MTTLLADFADLLGHDPTVRTRRVVTRSGVRVRGIFPSERFHKALQWESDLERRLLYRLEASWRVQEVCTQPLSVSIPCIDGSRFRLHTGRDCTRCRGNHRVRGVQTPLRAQKRKPSSSADTYRPTPRLGGHCICRRDGRQPCQLGCNSKRLANGQGLARSRMRSRPVGNSLGNRLTSASQLRTPTGTDRCAKGGRGHCSRRSLRRHPSPHGSRRTAHDLAGGEL